MELIKVTYINYQNVPKMLEGSYILSEIVSRKRGRYTVRNKAYLDSLIMLRWSVM